MKNRGEADLGVADMIVGKVFDRFEGDSLQCFFRLHHAGGDTERLKIEGKALLLTAFGKPIVQGFGIGRRKSDSIVVCKLDNSFDSNSAVEMIVKLHFGKLFDDRTG